MEEFAEFHEAISYAKSNIGFVVIRCGKKWIVGERNKIKPLTEPNKHKSQKGNNPISNGSRSINPGKEKDSYNYSYVEDGYKTDEDIENEEIEEQLRMDEYYENVDPDDWNRSVEEGWFYED